MRAAAIVMLLLMAGAGWADERAAQLLQPFKQELQAALKSGLAQGPQQAVTACREQAPAIAAAQSKEGVRMGRTSHRLRNPANFGPEWVNPVLQDWVKPGADREPVTLALGDGRMGYVEPILIQPLCLMCHGQAIEPGLAATINSLYPQDQATGFSDAELRGVFWVEFPAD